MKKIHFPQVYCSSLAVDSGKLAEINLHSQERGDGNASWKERQI